MKLNNNPLFFSTSILAFGIFFAKIIGSLYRILLTGFIGGEGLGVYQLIFPLYGVFLSISSSGVPTSLSKLIAQKREFSENYFAHAIKLCLKIGFICSVILVLLSYPMSFLQGKSVVWGYMIISPSVFIVSLLACYRGYFLGNDKMFSNSLLDILEIVIKVLVFVLIGLIVNTFSVYSATLSITVSEVISLFIMFSLKKKKGVKKQAFIHDKNIDKEIISNALPIAVLSLIIPFSQFIEGIIMINGLSVYTKNATLTFGLYSGSALSVIGFPVAVLYSISASSVPYIAKEKDLTLRKKKITKVLALAFILSVIGAFMIYLSSGIIVNFLFRSLGQSEKQQIVKLVKVMSVNVVFMTMMQVTNSLLIVKGKRIYPVSSLLIGNCAKFIILSFLITIPSINGFAGAYSLIACYFSTSLLNLYLIIRKEKTYADKAVKLGEYAN